jgi:orotate phosphoribosyltransferase
VRPAQAALAEVLHKYAIRTGDFTLASGRKSSWYLDGRMVTFRGDCVQIVGRAVVEALSAAGIDGYDAVGGLAVGAVPVAVAVAAVEQCGHRHDVGAEVPALVAPEIGFAFGS